MINDSIGALMGFLIGVLCQRFGLPLPAPPQIIGSLLVVFMTTGFLFADWLLKYFLQ